MNYTNLQGIINNIYNKSIRDFTVKCLKEAPDFLSEIPASKKYHPLPARAKGGLIWHIQYACWYANLFMQAYKWDCDGKKKVNNIKGDIVLSSLLLHDIGKMQKYPNWWDYINHPVVAVKMIQKNKSMLDERIWKYISQCVMHHMGPFGGDSFMKPLTKYNLLELVVYNSDFLSSRQELQVCQK